MTPTEEGQLGCVPMGTSPRGSTCTQGTPGAATGFDDCVSGNICISGQCKQTCRLSDPNSCGSAGVCSAYSALFANQGDDPAFGACVPTCDPLTGVPCGSGQACYLLMSQTPTVAVCAAAGTIQHGAPIVGSPFANTCVPGAMPRDTSQGSGMYECGGLCNPNEVTMGLNMADEGGIAPDSCEQRWGAPPPDDSTSGESCRFLWAREPTPSRYGNTIGFCFKHAIYQYDSNGDSVNDAPFPRCSTLTMGDLLPPISPTADGNDALDFWCLPLPDMKRGVAPRRLPAPYRSNMLTGWR